MSYAIQPPPRYLCPVTLELMQEPFMCRFCSNNFESSVIMSIIEMQAPCPTCRHVLAPQVGANFGDVSPNRALKEEIQEWLRHADEKVNLSNDESYGHGLMNARNAFCGVFVGKFGVGKSKTINSIAGRTVCVSAVSATGVTQSPSVPFDEILLNRQVKLIDAPGLFDPAKSNEETLTQLTDMLQKQIDGLDAVFHVIRMGRLDETELVMPLIILDGLAGDPVERARLAKRYKIIVTHCDSSDDDNDNETVANRIEQFRGVMFQTFPQELHGAIQNAIFIEHNQRVKSDYNDLAIFRAKVVNELVRCRELKATCFKPKMLSEVVEETRAGLTKLLSECFGVQQLDVLSNDDLLALQGFFQYVVTSGAWQQPRVTDRLSATFLVSWNGINKVVRDKIAVDMATRAVQALKDAAQRVTQKEAERRAVEKQSVDRRHQEELSRARERQRESYSSSRYVEQPRQRQSSGYDSSLYISPAYGAFCTIM